MRSIFFVIHQVLPWYLWVKWINSLVKNKILIAIYRFLWQCQIFFDKINVFFDKRIMSNKNCKNSLDFLFFFITYHNRRSGRKKFCWSRQLKNSEKSEFLIMFYTLYHIVLWQTQTIRHSKKHLWTLKNSSEKEQLWKCETMLMLD